jgi:hypothetical protein
MMKLLDILIAVILIQLTPVWAIAHLGVLLLGACAWAAWSWWKGRTRA